MPTERLLLVGANELLPRARKVKVSPEDLPELHVLVGKALGMAEPIVVALQTSVRPAPSFRVSACAARTLNATGTSRVTLSLQNEHLRAVCGPCQEERSLTSAQKTILAGGPRAAEQP